MTYENCEVLRKCKQTEVQMYVLKGINTVKYLELLRNNHIKTISKCYDTPFSKRENLTIYESLLM